MKILLEDISKVSYKDLKEDIDKILLKEDLDEFFEIGKKLLLDKRKNVNSLGTKLIKAKDKIENEILRIKGMYDFDRTFAKGRILAGVDEVGRGPLAGPIVSAAVILDLNVLDDETILYLNDSKKLSESKREELSKVIKEKAIAYSISELSSEEIDNKGISYCNNTVFLNAIDTLKVKPEIVLSDGYRVREITIPNEAVIKGDTKSATIAAASIIAKVYRDNLMKEYAKNYKGYGFESNVGYGAKVHIDAIKEKGITPIHRKSFLRNIL